jgi:hypothetical protein
MPASLASSLLLLTGAVAALVGDLALRSAPPVLPFRASASVVDLMRAHVDPSASALFAATAVTVDARGTREQAPTTPDEWLTLRRHAIILAESANLLMVAHRRIGAQPHLETMVWRDADTWNRHVRYLAEAAGWTLEAIDGRNAVRLQSHTGDIALACELCHLHYRYPGASRMLELPER